MRDGLARGDSGVIACSALKEKYREILRVDPARVHFVYLKGSFDLIWERMLLPPESLYESLDAAKPVRNPARNRRA